MYFLTYIQCGEEQSFIPRSQDPLKVLDLFCSAIEDDFLGSVWNNCLWHDGCLVARQALYNGVS